MSLSPPALNFEDTACTSPHGSRLNLIPSSMLTEKPKAPRIRHRHRLVISCTECHKQKKKCDRGNPCDRCLMNNKPQKCRYENSMAAKPLPRSRQKSWRKSEIELLIPKERRCEVDYCHARPSYSLLASEDLKFKVGSHGDFDILPITNGPDVDTLIHHFVTALAPWTTSIGSARSPSMKENIWLSIAISDPVLFHATLFASAVHIGQLRRQSSDEIALYYKTETIRLLNQSLHDRDRSTSDESIAAVFLILNFERVLGTGKEVDIHKKGFREMVAMRGLLGSFRLDGILRSLFCATNHMVAVLSGSQAICSHYDGQYCPEHQYVALSEEVRALQRLSSPYCIDDFKKIIVRRFHKTIAKVLEDVDLLIPLTDLTAAYLMNMKIQHDKEEGREAAPEI